MPADDAIRLSHMLDAARQAVQFCAGRRRAELGSDRMLVLALVKLLEIVGEAAAQVSSPSQTSLSGIPWADIIGMRHRLVHAYFDINLDILWRTVQEDLPPLIPELEAALHGERAGP
jgi:uncharacterized protein with HEPN domain